VKAPDAPTLRAFMTGLEQRNPGQPEYLQAVHEVVADVLPLVREEPAYRREEILRRIAEPDRVISFRVVWQDDAGQRRVERGWRVQHSNAIGPYKGGLRFTADLTESVLKFLAFEQTFKNSLTGLSLGAAKGGATFNPRGKSDDEVMRFCQAFMTELCRYIGPGEDVPAGDIGVGAREIGFLFGQYKRIVNRFEGALTGKGMTFGGSQVRAEATGFGAVLFAQQMLQHLDQDIAGKRIAISGSGNVALYAAQKALELGATVLTLSDSDGMLHARDGFDQAQLERIKTLKFDRYGRLADIARRAKGVSFHRSKSPWRVDCDIAMPCATQNELGIDDAKALARQGTLAVVEGANMPCTPEAVAYLRKSKVAYAPGKAANAGGVALSGLEMSQNAVGLSWDVARLNRLLENTMAEIHARCLEEGSARGRRVDYAKGANRAGFRKVADAMIAYGLV
jgi:glutamate dehydrogenase (NADP+)